MNGITKTVAARKPVKKAQHDDYESLGIPTEFSFNPDTMYTILELMRRLQKSQKWVKKYVLNGGCRHCRVGTVVFVKGRWLIDWVEYESAKPKSHQ